MSTYTTSLGLEEITPGDQAGLWGNTTNNNLELIDQAVTGVTPISFTGLSGTVRVLDSANGALDEARAAVINITGTAAGSNTIVVPNRQKTYLVRNNTGQGVIFRTASPSATYTVDAGNSILVFCDGNNNVFTGIASPSVGTLSVSAGGTGQTTFGGGGFVISSGGTNSLTTQASVGVGGTATTQITGEVQVPNGGTGLSNVPAGSLLVGNGVLDMTVVSTGTTGQVLTSNGAGANPSFQTPSAAAVSSIIAGTGISVSSPTGAVTVTNTGPTLGSTNTWTGANTFNGGASILGITNGSTASAGYVGQLVSSIVNNISVTNSTDTVLTSIVLTPGDWDISGSVGCNNNGNILAFNAAVNTSPVIAASTGFFLNGGATFGPVNLPVPFTPTNITSTQTIYLLTRISYNTGPTALALGQIFARRIR
jgi:hypothetical protein